MAGAHWIDAVSEWIGSTESGAVFNETRTHRFSLWRRWTGLFDAEPAPISRMLAFICLNPSTANETANDPTVARGIKFAKRWGLDGFVMLNLFGFRATEPADMKRAPDPVGDGNDEAILWVASRAARVVCAWGVHGVHMGRDEEVKTMLRNNDINAECFIRTKDGHPRHPLYVRGDSEPSVFVWCGH